VFLILLAVGYAGKVEAQEKTPPRPPWVIVEQKVICPLSNGRIPQYIFKGRTLWGQRWTIFTNSTDDFEWVSPGLVYRCFEEFTGSRWCSDGMIERMRVTYLPEVHRAHFNDAQEREQ
jgi:hypothetical protein